MRWSVVILVLVPSMLGAQRLSNKVWDYARVVSEINTGMTGVNDIAGATKWAVSTIESDISSDPITPFGGSLAESLRRGLKAVRQVDCGEPSNLSLSGTVEAANTREELSARRKRLSETTASISSYKDVIAKTRKAEKGLLSLADHAARVGSAAQGVGDRLAALSGSPVQAFQDHAGYAAVDFLTIYVPLLSQIENEARSKGGRCASVSARDEVWLSSTRRSLKAQLMQENTSLLRVAAGIEGAGVEADPIPIATRTVEAQKALDALVARWRSIQAEEARLLQIRDAAVARFEAFNLTGQDPTTPQYDELMRQFSAADSDVTNKAKAYWKFVNDNKQVRANISKSATSLRNTLDQLKNQASEVSEKDSVKRHAAALIDGNHRDLAKIEG